MIVPTMRGMNKKSIIESLRRPHGHNNSEISMIVSQASFLLGIARNGGPFVTDVAVIRLVQVI